MGKVLLGFEEITRFIIEHIEKGYVNNPNDPGGETKFGISKRAYPDVDIKNLSMEDALSIYRSDYWLKASVSLVPSRCMLLHMDSAIHHGPTRAIKLLQESVGATQDGIIGRQTLDAAHNLMGEDLLISYFARRAIFLSGLKGFKHFSMGWMRRLFLLALHS
jgi:lysozyme family protein